MKVLKGILRQAICLPAVLTALCNCTRSDVDPVGPGTPGEQSDSITGMFLLNEGNMGTNKCTIDYFDYASGKYSRDIFTTNNPDVVQALGDCGNDIAVYGGKVYAVINKSNLVEVMDAGTFRHIARIEVATPCRLAE